MLPFELIKDTPYLALSGELWSVFYEYFNRNWSCYRGFLLYLKSFLMDGKNPHFVRGQYHCCIRSINNFEYVLTDEMTLLHVVVIRWKHFPCYWPFVRGIHWSPVNSPHKGQWRGALMYSFICTWTNGWANNRDASDLRCHHTHYDVTVMHHGWWDLARHCVTTIAYNWCSTAVIWCKFYWNKLQVFGKSLFYYVYKEILSVPSMLMCNCKQNMMPVCNWWNYRFCNSNPPNMS